MKNKDSKDLGEFGLSALALDRDFSEMERLSDQLEELDVESEYGFEQSCKLLLKFGECGQRIGDGMQSLAKELEEARIRAEASAQKVSLRALAIQERRQQNDEIAARFQKLGEMVKVINESVLDLSKRSQAKLGPDEKASLTEHLPTINLQLGTLLDEANRLKDDARNAKLKQMEKNAHALGQGLLAVRTKLTTLAGKH